MFLVCFSSVVILLALGSWVPVHLRFCFFLPYRSLNDNKLSGEIPDSFQVISQLVNLYVPSPSFSVYAVVVGFMTEAVTYVVTYPTTTWVGHCLHLSAIYWHWPPCEYFVALTKWELDIFFRVLIILFPGICRTISCQEPLMFYKIFHWKTCTCLNYFFIQFSYSNQIHFNR